MHIEFYCDLKVSECWQKKVGKIKRKLRTCSVLPSVYVIALAQGKQNQLEFFSGILMKQHVFENTSLFVIGIADGYDDALYMVEDITRTVYKKTEGTDIRRYVLARQREYNETGR